MRGEQVGLQDPLAAGQTGLAERPVEQFEVEEVAMPAARPGTADSGPP
ncbi:hypothetical protein AB0J21_08280 [Streptomyces sp. NPDC049954]